MRIWGAHLRPGRGPGFSVVAPHDLLLATACLAVPPRAQLTLRIATETYLLARVRENAKLRVLIPAGAELMINQGEVDIVGFVEEVAEESQAPLVGGARRRATEATRAKKERERSFANANIAVSAWNRPE